ncbi:MAG: DUF1924 domain-containing protein [Gallionella sp.]
MLRTFIALLCFAALMGSAHAETPAEILAGIKTEAANTAGFQGFSATRGETFFKAKHGGEWSCSSCHTDNPMNSGKHAKTEKVIKPMAPKANEERFTEPKKVAKWFKRNCNDVLDRECTAQEQGDVMTYLLAVGQPVVAAPVAAVAKPVEAAPAAHTHKHPAH